MYAGAVITAAGKSSRMGAFKPLLEIGGIPAAERVILNFRAAGVEDIVLVTGRSADELEGRLKHLGVAFLRNAMYESTEMFDSVKIGLGYLADRLGEAGKAGGNCRVFITPADVPLFTADTVKALLKCGARAAIPTFNGQEGHPVVLDGGAAAEVLRYAGSGGLRGALLSLEPQRVETGDCGILYDMDTRADYAEILKLHAERRKREKL